MSASFEKTTSKNLQIGSTHTVLECLDALASGACDPESFLAIVIDLIRRAPDTSWEVLSLLDQNYRRGKIKPELFQRLKARLQSVALGNAGVDGQQSAALPHTLEPTATTAPITVADPEHQMPPAAPYIAPDRTAARSRESAPSRKRFYMGDLLRGRYRLARVISQGAGASMFETNDEFFQDLPEPGRKVALKMLSASIASDRDAYANVRREFQRLQALSHPNVLRVHEFDRDGDSAFFTMELLSGASLRRVMRAREQAPLTKAHALSITRAVGDVLIFAIDSGISHGLISLRNIFITDDGDLRILDFGTAETLDGQNPNLLDDPYALACVAYTLIAGKHPYQNRPAVEARADGLQPVRPAGLSGRQWRALRAGLSLERSDRPSSVTEWLYRLDPRREVQRLPTLAELENGTAAPPVGARSPAYAAYAAIAVLAAIAAGAVMYPQAAERLVHGSADGLSSAANGITSFVSEKLAALHTAEPKPADPVAASVAASTAAPQSLPSPPAHVAPATVRAPASQEASAPPVAAAPAAAATTTAAAAAAPAAGGGAPIAAAREPTIARIEFAADTTEVAPTDSTARVIVRRKGNLHGEASFTWWTESGTAKPGSDFTPVNAQTAQFDPGKDRVSLLIPIIANAASRSLKNFYVVIDAPGPGASLGGRTLSMVSIVPPDAS